MSLLPKRKCVLFKKKSNNSQLIDKLLINCSINIYFSLLTFFPAFRNVSIMEDLRITKQYYIRKNQNSYINNKYLR